MTSIIVRTESQLLAAAAASREADVSIRLMRTIEVMPGIICGRADLTTEVYGGGLDWSGYASRWQSGKLDQAGLLFKGNVDLHDVDLQAYNGSASAVKWDSTRGNWVRVQRCEASGVGTMQLMWLGNDQTKERGRTQVFEGHNDPDVVEIRDCGFLGCCTNEESLSHCSYVDGNVVALSGNRYVNCGNPWGAWGQVLSTMGEHVYRPVYCDDIRTSTARYPRMLIVSKNQPAFTFCLNRIEGQVSGFSWGLPKSGSRFFGNDLSGMTCTDWWAWDHATNAAVTQEVWDAKGYK
jgi:hypothetical protein